MSLESALQQKQERLDKANWVGECWLALINTYFLADAQTYITCMNKLNSSYSFAKIVLLATYGSPSICQLLN